MFSLLDMRRDAIRTRHRYAVALRNRTLNTIGSALCAALVPPLAVVAWVVMVGWMIAAGIALFEVVFWQCASTSVAEPEIWL